MLSPIDLQLFHENGYIIVPSVYDVTVLQSVRELFLTAFDREMWRQTPNSSPTIINDIYKFFPKTVDIVFNAKYMSSFLLFNAIQKCKQLPDIEYLDFEGSMLEFIKQFFRSFGGEPCSYLNIQFNQLPLVAKWMYDLKQRLSK